MRYLRGVVEGSDLTLRSLGARLKCSDTTVSKYLSGIDVPGWGFVAGLVRACTPVPRLVEPRVREARVLWDQAVRSSGAPADESALPDLRDRLLAAQATTIRAQHQLIEVGDELNRARLQLYESALIEHRASHLVLVLQLVLVRMSGLLVHTIAERGRERARAEAQLAQARTERDRATVLAQGALGVISVLEQRLSGPRPLSQAGEVVALPALTVEEVLLDVQAGLDRVQRILDEHERKLVGLETDDAAVALMMSHYEDAPLGVAVVVTGDRIYQANAALVQVLGYEVDGLAGMALADLWLTGPDGEHWLMRSDGRVMLAKVHRWRAGGVEMVVFEEAEHPRGGWHDHDTGLPNSGWYEAWLDAQDPPLCQTGARHRASRVFCGICRAKTGFLGL